MQEEPGIQTNNANFDKIQNLSRFDQSTARRKLAVLTTRSHSTNGCVKQHCTALKFQSTARTTATRHCRTLLCHSILARAATASHHTTRGVKSTCIRTSELRRCCLSNLIAPFVETVNPITLTNECPCRIKGKTLHLESSQTKPNAITRTIL